MRKVYLAVGLGAVAFGVYSYYIKQYEILNTFKYSLKNLKIKSSTLKQINLQLTYEVINDSSISVTLTDYNLDILVNGEKVGVVKNSTINQYLAKDGGKSFFTMDVAVTTASLLSANVSLGLLEDFKNSKLGINGTFGMKWGIVRWGKIPYSASYKVKDFL